MSTPIRKMPMRDFKRLQQDLPARISRVPQDNIIMLSTSVKPALFDPLQRNVVEVLGGDDGDFLEDLVVGVKSKAMRQ
ncbi:hypothetical protein FF1_030189 [Malus domestica]